ncbi:MAG: ATP-binding cassette domain-containing protein [Steroidobacteraceae bacterium]|nr:ABC transporter ATP-binding protein [Nevskiaceae bacterium]MCP5338730.1 ABC transporter ATP-binding protein [Nevskiaceae bacterium]MCP5360875.1 ABC transporter ATP-binding protein [Nevskiaceae bacterium]MCP5473107.1 ABC transporter ATP-binding protein [Nevskiaceae bacterium]
MSTAAIRLSQVSKSYRSTGRYFGSRSSQVQAVRDVSLEIAAGAAFALVGESGSGKSTLARMITGLEAPDAGRIEVSGMVLLPRTRHEWQTLRRRVQIVFQDPYSALDPLMTIGRSIEEPLISLTDLPASTRRGRVVDALHSVGLPDRVYDAYPHQLSGGERQRVCIARALAPRPDIIVCDEPVSALDRCTQSQVIELLRELKRERNLTYVFISHDLSTVELLCDEVAVMRQGEIIEHGPCSRVMAVPEQPYTRDLLEAARYFQQGLAGEA